MRARIRRVHVLVDVRGGAPGRTDRLCVGVEDLEQWVGEVLRLAESQLDRPVIVLGQADQATRHAVDMYSGGGYYAELLAHVVGPEGHVSAHNNRAYLSFAGDEIEARYANGRLDQVETLMAENNELSLAPASYDAITLVLTYHDFYLADPDNGWPAIDAEALRAELFKGLRPGGVVGIIDHAAPRGAPSSTGGDTHRIDPDIVFREMAASGFILERHSALLNNPADDRLKSAFDPSIRGRTDRFMMRFRKP